MAQITDKNTDKWYFTKEQLDQTPSRKCGYDKYKELSHRQQTANFIQDMGQRLKVSQLCINTAIVYMHRFYVFHSFTHFPWHQMASAALFLAAKVEEQPRKLEYVIRMANLCRNSNIDVTSERYIAQAQDLVFNENVLLQTLGFDVAIDHPHTHVVRCCDLVRASKDLAQSSYFLASNSLHLTTMCLQYKPTVVACFCVHLACKWSSWEIPLSSERKEWFLYVDPTVTADLLKQLTEEFLSIFESCPSRLKQKIMALGDNGIHNGPNTILNSPFDVDPKKLIPTDLKDSHSHRSHDSKTGFEHDIHKQRTRPHESITSNSSQKERDYRERKEREKLAQQHQHGLKLPISTSKSQSVQPTTHHRPPPLSSSDPTIKLKQQTRPQQQQQQQQQSLNSSNSNTFHQPTTNRTEPRDILREAARDSPFGIATKDYSRDFSNKDHVRISDNKDILQKRDYLLKTEFDHRLTNDVRMSSSSSLSSRTIDTKLMKQQQQQQDIRRHDSVKLEGVDKKYLTDKNSTYLNKTMATSQKIKSPFTQPIIDNTTKSVPKLIQQPKQQQQQQQQQHYNNGNTLLENLNKMKEEPIMGKLPSLFSPEKSPKNCSSKKNNNNNNNNNVTDVELRPVIKKIDQIEGFENLMRDSTIGINKLHQIPDIIQPILDNIDVKKEIKEEQPKLYSKEMRPPDIILPISNDLLPIGNGIIETNPMLISSLLKETPTIPHLPAVANLNNNNEVHTKQEDKEHHHHKSKKKNKDKHKHKDDKEKKKKHKDKEKEKHKHKHELITEPIKIKIHKDKIHSISSSSTSSTSEGGLKIKIPKDVIKTETIGNLQQQQSSIGLKIKIPKDKINNCSSDNSRKRERLWSPMEQPPNKMPRSSHHKDTTAAAAAAATTITTKQNGRHSYNKVTQMGDGDTSIHRLAESNKYINKNSSTQ